ncbi:MAG: winged helix-turn-helix transcriptional regulator [Bacteroidetes bacterium]|nr:winged helix-turn-helix transcriptional regulator [Bacteroidota bacterium]
MQTRRDVFQAIADPTRREIINLVAFQSLNLNAIAEKFDVSRPAISQHIKLLTECGLIVIKKQGRERYCEARLSQLNEVSDWIEKYRKLWAGRFDMLDDILEEMKAASSAKQKKQQKKNPKQIKKHTRKITTKNK